MDSPATAVPLTAALVWHAVSAVVAWGLLAPLSQLVWRLPSPFQPISSSSSSPDAFRFKAHRVVTISVLLLTLQAYFIALYSTHYSSSSAAQKRPQHPALASILVFTCLFQAALAYMRPLSHASWARTLWRVTHVCLGVTTITFGLYIIQHSVRLFHVTGWLRTFTFVSTAVGAVVASCGIVVSSYLWWHKLQYQPVDQEEHGEGEGGEQEQEEEEEGGCNLVKHPQPPPIHVIDSHTNDTTIHMEQIYIDAHEDINNDNHAGHR